MICPKCGNKLPDDKLYCEKCGSEFQIVPDFDVEVDGEIDKTLRNLRKPKKVDDLDDIEFDNDPNLLASILNGHAGNKIVYVFMVLILLVIIAIIVVQGRKISRQNTLEYQLEKISELSADKQFSSAIPYLEKAYKITGDVSYLFTVADYYYTMGRENDAIFKLGEIIGDPKASDKDVEDAYRKTITLYENASNYTKLCELVENCPIAGVKNDYAKYLVKAPEFSAKEGTYEEEILLKFISDTKNGVIYYTLDGTTPNESSNVFTTPIFLENGNYTVSAICYNAYGVASDVVTQKYLINVAFEFKPIVLTESGEYNTATQIKCDVPATERYYYTTDGSDPDNKSAKYSNPIQMPYGHSVFKFISYAMDGTQSEIGEYEYDLKIDGLQPEDCYNALRGRLVEKGLITAIDNYNSYRDGVEGFFTYEFINVYEIEGKGDYYFYTEYINDFEGRSAKTNIIYAVSVTHPDRVYRVSGNGTTGYILNDF